MSIKRTIITTILALALVAMVAPAPAQADQLSDLMALVSSLQAQIAALQGGGTPVPTGGIACAGVTFTRTLVVGSTGSDVKCLQVLLNANGYTLAQTGAGSPGMETSYFGPATLAAVRVFQAAKGMVPANQVGPQTRAALNALINSAPVVPVTPVAGLPVGCTSTTGFSPVTGVSCATVAPIVGTTGFISISTLSPTPASNANVTATSNVPVLGVNIKAINSNMTVGSAKVQLAVLKGVSAEHPATLVRELYVYDGSTLLGSFPISTGNIIKSGSDYYVILSGFNFMIPANATKTLTINADFAPSLETSRTLTVNLYGTDAVRAIDGTGAYTTAYLATTRVYTVAYATVGSSTLTVTANTNTPAETSINVNSTDGTTDVPMLVFNAKSTVGASQITDLVFTVTGNDAGSSAKVTAIKLYDGSTLLGSVSLTGSGAAKTATFSDLTIDVAKDATKTLTVKADIAADVTAEDTLVVSVAPGSQVTYNKPDLSSAYASGTTVTGKTMYVFDGQAVTFALVGATSAYTYNSTTPTSSYTTGVITLKVRANGGTATEPVASDFTVLAYANGSSVGEADSKSITVTPDDVISDGTESTVVINVSEPRASSGTGFVYFKISNIAWYITDGTTSTDVNTQTWGLTDLKTPTANVQ